MNNLPKVKIGIVAVSRDCFPETLSVNRRKALVEAYQARYDEADIYECPVCIVESEIHMVQALEDVKKAGCNALCVYLEISALRFPRRCWRSILTALPCLWRRRRRPRTIWWGAEATPTAACSTPATI